MGRPNLTDTESLIQEVLRRVRNTTVAAAGALVISAGAASAALASVTFGAGGGVTFGLAGGVITASAPAAGGGAGTGATISTTAGTNIVATLSTNGLSLRHPAWLTTAQPVGAYLTTAQPVGAYLTTAALSQDSSKYAGTGATIGTTAGTDLVATQNTAGLSLRHRAWLTTAAQSNHSHGNPTLALTNLNGTTASASNGFTLSLSAAAAGGGGAGTGATISTTTGSALLATLSTNGLSLLQPNWLTTAQSPGAYLTTAALSGDTTKYAGLGVTLSTTGGTDIVATLSTNGLSLRYPAWLTTAQPVGAYLTTAALSQDSSKYAGTNGAITGGSITVNTSGVSINILPVGTINQYEAFEAQSNVGAISDGTWSFYPIEIPERLHASRIALFVSAATQSSATAGVQVSVGLYTLNGSTLSLSSSGSMSLSWTSGSNSSSNWGGLVGPRLLTVPAPGNTITPGQYFLGVALRSSNAGTWTIFGMSTAPFSGMIGQDSANSKQMAPGYGYFSASSAAPPASVALSALTGSGNGQRFPWFNFHNATA